MWLIGFVLAGTSLSRLIELDEERIKARQRLECVRFIAALARRRADLPPPLIASRMSMDSGDKSPHSKRFATGNDFWGVDGTIHIPEWRG